MNETQKRTLRIHNPDLVHDLELTADVVARFIHHGIFNEDMIEEIKHEKTRKDQIQKMLLILPRRGPRAFEMFLHSIEEAYPWLVQDLRKTHTKINPKTEPDMSLKQKVDIYVHEKFGNSKRFSEEDKKDIRKFLYRQLKQTSELGYDAGRRDSIGSMTGDIDKFNQIKLQQVSEKDIEIKILQKVQNILDSGNSDGKDNQTDSEGFDDVDGPHDQLNDSQEISIDIIAKRITELNEKVDIMQNEIKNVYTTLGVEEGDKPLHELIEELVDDKTTTQREFTKMQENLENLEHQRNMLEKTITETETALERTVKELANEKHESEKVQHQTRQLKSKCEQLEKLHLKHVEKEQTLITLKQMVKQLSPVHHSMRSEDPFKHPIHEHDVNSGGGGGGTGGGGGVSLPKLSPVRVTRQSRQSRQSHQIGASPERSIGHHHAIGHHSIGHHHELPRPKISNNGLPWKF